MISHFQGQRFLKEVDFSKPELETLIQLAAHFKYLKQQRISHPYLQGKTLRCMLKKSQPEPGQVLQWRLMIWARTLSF